MAIQLTLISLYGKKKPEFASLIARVQKSLSDAMGDAFTPYDLDQVHATIVGLVRSQVGFENDNFAKFRNRRVTMDFDGFLAFVRGGGHFPFEVQFGGFEDSGYPFTSRNSNPYERSFSIQGDKAVLVGWPVRREPVLTTEARRECLIQESRIYPLTLDLLRHSAQGFGILHGYHRAPTDVDNDLFVRVGLIDPKSVKPGGAPTVEQYLRQQLGQERPLILELTLEDVFVAAYEDNTLPVSSTKIWSITDARVDGRFLCSLYRPTR